MKFKLIRLYAYSLLFLTAVIWGVTFAAQKSAMDAIGPFMFNGIRCLLGAFSLFLISFFFKDNKKYKRCHLIEGGIVSGVFLFLGTTLQQVGIVTSSATHAGFISSLYIVMVPIFSLIAGKKISNKVWLGVFLALFGLYLLCVKGTDFSINQGDLTILFSGVFFAFHIMSISKYSKKTKPVHLCCIQFLIAGTFAFILGLMFEATSLSAIRLCSLEIFIAGFLSCAVGFTLQIEGQKLTKPYIASLIMSLESVFAAVSGYLFLNETLTVKEFSGCVLMLIAVFVAKSSKKHKSGETSL